jgi:hypothetical protein
MRTEVEIRTALVRLGRDGENEELQVTDDGVLLPLNHIAKDVLRWVLSEPSDFGAALAEVLAMWESADRAGRN